MAVSVRRAPLGANHAVRGVSQLVDDGRFYRLGEARPAASRFTLVGWIKVPSASKRSWVLYKVPPSRSFTPTDTTTPACLAASLMASVAGDGTVTAWVDQLPLLGLGDVLQGGWTKEKYG
jgi:hypothetical protein